MGGDHSINKALLLCHGTVCVVGKMRDMILQLSKSSIYSTKPPGMSQQHLLHEADLSAILTLPSRLCWSLNAYSG
ncbi:hypothetical protein D0898_27320 (plasmid) [Klebsiella pneumoniae]|nr:hypothetical protein D0898_27320 [Klebsiella pneumoniae]